MKLSDKRLLEIFDKRATRATDLEIRKMARELFYARQLLTDYTDACRKWRVARVEIQRLKTKLAKLKECTP